MGIGFCPWSALRCRLDGQCVSVHGVNKNAITYFTIPCSSTPLLCRFGHGNGVGVSMQQTMLSCLHRTNVHWGQRGSYLAGKLRVCWEFFNNLLSIYPGGKLWDSQFTHHFDLDGISGHIESKFQKNPSKNPVDSFSIYSACAWATHWEFFHKIPWNLTTMCLAIYLMSSLRVHGKTESHWEFSLKCFK